VAKGASSAIRDFMLSAQGAEGWRLSTKDTKSTKEERFREMRWEARMNTDERTADAILNAHWRVVDTCGAGL
jgi:hypothetical protein